MSLVQKYFPWIFSTLSILAISILLFGCGSKTDRSTVSDEIYYVGQSVVDVLGEACADTEIMATGVGSYCNYANLRSVCSNESLQESFPFCGWQSSQTTANGDWTNTYSSTQACSSFRAASELAINTSVVRTAQNLFYKIDPAQRLVISSDAHTSYDSSAIGAGVQISRGTSTDRDIAIRGVKRVFSYNDNEVYSHSLLTTSPITIVGKRSDGTRKANGTVTVKNNTTLYSATVTLADVKWANSTCCYPTSGTLSIVIGAATSSLNFLSICGNATFVDSTNASKTIGLGYCAE